MDEYKFELWQYANGECPVGIKCTTENGIVNCRRTENFFSECKICRELWQKINKGDKNGLQ